MTCAATTVIAGASLALAAAGTAMTVKGQIDAQAAAGAQAGYMAKVQRNNAELARRQAAMVREQGQIDADKQRQLTSQRIGTQTAQLAVQGTDLEGSPTDILGDTAKAGELDAQTIRSNAAKQAWGYEVGAANAGANAGLYGSFQPSYLGAGSSLLGGASTLADKWNKFRHNDPSGDSWGDASWVGSSGRAPGSDGM